MKTVTGNKKCVSRLSVNSIGHGPVTLAFQEQNLQLQLQRQNYQKKDNWSEHSDLGRILEA